MKKPKKRPNAAARALASPVLRQRIKPSKKLYRRKGRSTTERPFAYRGVAVPAVVSPGSGSPGSVSPGSVSIAAELRYIA